MIEKTKREQQKRNMTVLTLDGRVTRKSGRRAQVRELGGRRKPSAGGENTMHEMSEQKNVKWNEELGREVGGGADRSAMLK